MPLYEYECVTHGVFEDQRSIARSADPNACPMCRAPAPRIVSAPNLSCMERSQVKARDRNEQSKHEPRIAQTFKPASDGRPKLRSGQGYPWALGH